MFTQSRAPPHQLSPSGNRQVTVMVMTQVVLPVPEAAAGLSDVTDGFLHVDVQNNTASIALPSGPSPNPDTRTWVKLKHGTWRASGQDLQSKIPSTLFLPFTQKQVSNVSQKNLKCSLQKSF